MYQELHTRYDNLYYYDNKKNGEIDFLIDDYDNLSIHPIEVKSGKNFTTHSAISKFVNNDDHNVKQAIVLSYDINIKYENGILYLPIYFMMFL